MTFFLTIIFMFLVFWRPQEWLVPWMFGIPVLQAIGYISALSLMMDASQQTVRFPKTPAIMLAAGLWFATIMSHVGNGYLQGVLDTIPDTFKPCLLVILLLAVVDRIARARIVVLVFVVAAIIMSIHALMQQQYGYGFAGHGPLSVYDDKTGTMQTRSQFFGPFEDPNDLGQFLAGAIPLVFAYPRRLNPVTFAGALAVAWLIFDALLSTHSRGGIVALSAAGACLLLLRLPTRWVPYGGVVMLFVVLVLCSTMGSSLMDMSARERLDFWGLANWRFKHQPIFGIGYGMFWEVAGDRAAHNAFVCCYTEIGLFGYWFWFGLMQLGITGCWRSLVALRRPRNESQAYLKRLASLSIASMVGFAAGGYFLSRTFVFAFFFLFGLLNAVPLIAQRLLPDDHPSLLDSRRDVYLAVSVGTLFSVVYVYLTILVLNRAR